MSLLQLAKTGIQTVQNGRSYVDTLANKYIVKPKTVKGIGGFLFDYEGDSTLNLQADITDHYSETNVAIQDHIAIKPLRMTLKGFISELAVKKPEGLLGALEQIQNKLSTVPAYLGKYTPGGIKNIQKAITKTQNVVNTIDQSLARVKNIVGFFDKTTQGRTAQEKAYNKLQTLMVTKQLVFVQTPYGTFNNMAIESLVFVQDETTKTWSDITVTLKHLNLVDVKTSTIDVKATRNYQQSQSAVDQGGTSSGKQDKTLAAKIFDSFRK